MLPTATLVIACYLVTQLLKPALSIKVLPQEATWSNNALRALVFLIAYVLTVVNTITVHRLDWTGAWGLIPAAAAVASVAIASYHILNDAVGPATPVTAPSPSKPVTAPSPSKPVTATGILPPVEHAPVSVPSNTTPQAVAVGGKHSTKVITSGAPATVTAGTPAPPTPPAGQTPPGGA